MTQWLVVLRKQEQSDRRYSTLLHSQLREHLDLGDDPPTLRG